MEKSSIRCTGLLGHRAGRLVGDTGRPMETTASGQADPNHQEAQDQQANPERKPRFVREDVRHGTA